MAEENGDATSIVENLLMGDDEDDDDDDNDDDDNNNNDDNNDDDDDGDPATAAPTTFDAIHDINDPMSTPTLLYSRADEQQDMNATIEHLVITGNYYRHQQWRMKEWEHNYDESRHLNDKNQMNENSNDTLPSRRRHKRRRNSDLVAASESFRSSRCSSEQDVASTSSSSQQQQQQQRKTQRQSPVATHILHAQDSRLYNPHNDKNDGMEPDLWPKPPYTMAKEAPLSDQRWEQEWSDAIDPIAFSILRLSENIVEDSQPSYYSNDISCPDATLHSNNTHEAAATAARILLMQCWERAVHAAANTITISSSSLHEQQSTSPILPPVTTPTTSNTNTNNRNKIRTRNESIQICQQLQLSPQLHTTTSTNTVIQPVDKYQCSGCRAEFTTKQLLHDHFYGKEDSKDDDDDDDGCTCAWMCIDAQRRKRMALVLENEVRTISQQFINHILFHPDAIRHSTVRQHSNENRNSPPSTTVSRCMDGLDIMKMVQQELLTSRKIMSTGQDTDRRSIMNATSSIGSNRNVDDSIVFETLEVAMEESPLPINAAVLEAVRYRWMDRYGRVPR